MGGVSSSPTKDGVDFEDRLEYGKWPLIAVEQAYQRLQADRATRECADLSLTKREFWETFTDYATIVEGQFLNLPMEQYAIFDPENKQSVYALEVFATLALFCNGELPAKLKFIFVMFDFDKSDGISRDEMVMMLRCVTRALYRIGLTESFPEYEELEILANEMFSEASPLGGEEEAGEAGEAGEANSSREASLEEISEWATNHISANDILSRFQENPNNGLKKICRRKSMVRYHELHDGETTAVDEFLSTTSSLLIDATAAAAAATEDQEVQQNKKKKPRRSTKDIVPDHLLGNMRRQVSRVKRLSSGRVMHRVTSQSLGKGLRKDRSNMLTRIATKSCMRELTFETQFSLSEVKKMRGDFAKYAGEDATLSRESFGKILTLRFPNLKESSMLERMYKVFDADSSGSIDFTEFCTGLTRLLKGTANEKLSLLFELYDKNGDGTIGLTELLDVVSESDQTLASEAQFAAQIMESLDVDGDGAITQDEFVQVLEKEPALMANFSRRISQRSLVSLQDHRAIMTLDDGNQGFTYKGIIDLINELAKDETWNGAHQDHTVTSWEFKQLMRDHFSTSENSVKFFDRAYGYLDKEKTDKVDLRDLLNALVQTLNITNGKKAAFFFYLYDFDGSGTLDADELLRIVLEGRERSGAESKEFLDTVKKFDTNGDNAIDCEEFRATILNNPNLLKTFGLLFNATGTTNVIEDAATEAATEAAEAVAETAQVEQVEGESATAPTIALLETTATATTE